MGSSRHVLGAVIAGGRSLRFGSDKGMAKIEGVPMISHVIDALSPQVAAMVMVGRAWPGLRDVPDTRPGKAGPLAGLEAALGVAVAEGYDGILSVPVDCLPLPANLAQLLVGDGPAVFREQYLIGYWPSGCAAALAAHLDEGQRSLTSWIERVNARRVDEPVPIVNVNRPEDLASLR